MITMGGIVRSVSPALHGYLSAVSNREYEAFPPRRIVASKPIHKKLKSLFASRKGYFIEAGANNGVKGSNTYYLEEYCGWTGLLIEPIPHRFVECRQARRGSHSVHCGLVSDTYSKEYVELVYMDLMSMVRDRVGALDLSTQLEKSLRTKRYGDDLTGTTFFAPARTLCSVLQDHGFPQVDFLSLDVEGHELDVLKGNDFERCSPRYILVEDWDKAGVGELLATKGYEVEERMGDRDTLYRLA